MPTNVHAAVLSGDDPTLSSKTTEVIVASWNRVTQGT